MKNIFVHSITTVNVGDDLFMQMLFKRYPDIKMVLYAPSTYKLMFKSFSNVKVVSDNDKFVKRIIRLSKFLHLPQTMLIYGFLTIKFKINLFLVVGGSLFMEGNSNTPSILRRIHYFKCLFPRMKVAVIGSNFGPCSTVNFFNSVRKSLHCADDVCFRDRASYEAFAELSNVRWGNDIVMHSRIDKDCAIIKKKNVCINIRSVERWESLRPYKEKYLQTIKSLVSDFQAKGYSISLLSFCEKYGDHEISDELYEQIENKNSIEKLYYKGELNEIINKIAESEYMIATRFHAIILCLIYNVKVLPVSYSIKTENMLKSLNIWDDIFDFGTFCNTPIEVLRSKYLANIQIDESKNVQFDWLDNYLEVKPV